VKGDGEPTTAAVSGVADLLDVARPKHGSAVLVMTFYGEASSVPRRDPDKVVFSRLASGWEERRDKKAGGSATKETHTAAVHYGARASRTGG
jgi:hypothetical protein